MSPFEGVHVVANVLNEASPLVSLVRDFARDVVAPRVMEYDREEYLPRDILERMGPLGFFGGTVPEEWGGAGLSHVEFAQIIEEISRVDHLLGVLMSMPSALVGGGIMEFGTEAQKRRWLAPLAQGEIFGGAGVTEPQSGTDVAGMQTSYRREGDEFVIRGAKTWISNLDLASFFVTFATRSPGARDKGAISAFIIPRDAVGLSIHPFKNKLGFRPLSTGELVLDEVRVGTDCLLGEEGGGFNVAMTAVERGRLSVAARAVGLAQSCLDACVGYAQERVVFGASIGSYQMTQRKIADMAVEIEAARCLVLKCAEAMDSGHRSRIEASMAKMYASDVAQRVATEAVQIHGAYGVSEEFIVARAYRDSKIFQIVEGTNELHRLLIARSWLESTSTS